ncbi:type VI immunity family protein [Rhizobacter sp. P5_C2]
MTDTEDQELRILEELQLQLNVRSGEYCAARTGVTLVLYYGRSTRNLAGAVGRLVDLYLAAIPEGAMRSTLSATGIWRGYTKQGLSTQLRRLTAQDVEYTSIHLSSGEPAHMGDYGFHFFGSDLSNFELWPRETCSCILEFPLSVLRPGRREHFEDFVAEAAAVEPFESGYAGYAFKHLSETWGDQAMPWIAQKAPRFLGLDISYDSFAEVARRRVVNVSWITLLGQPLVDDLGGEAQIRSQLSSEVRLRSIASGLAIVAGEVPPIGDVNRGPHDLQWLKEVAALTRPVRASMEIDFGSETFRRTWLSRLD